MKPEKLYWLFLLNSLTMRLIIEGAFYMDFSTLVIRPIHSKEREYWDQTMKGYHYLGFRQLVGESLRYIAFLENEPVALSGWSSAAYKSRHRDEWIGWSEAQRHERLRFVANHARFLILPRFHLKNLASKLLSMNIKRLSNDWQFAYGHPVVLAETFVDHQRFTGACYRGAGWIPLGKTRGFRRNAGRYYAHGESKTILIKPLQPNVPHLLASPFLPPPLNPKALVDVHALGVFNKNGLMDRLAVVRDERMARGIRFSHVSILAVGICGWLSGARSLGQMGRWAAELPQFILKQFGCRYDDHQRKHTAPSDETLRRIFHATDGEWIDLVIQQWLEATEARTDVDRKVRQDAKHLLKHPEHRFSAVFARQCSRYARSVTDGNEANDPPYRADGSTIRCLASHTPQWKNRSSPAVPRLDHMAIGD
jgi:hypothetical protein